MKTLKIAVLALAAIGMVFSAAVASKHMPAERGKALFNDEKFSGGVKSCNSCHPNGRGLEKEFQVMGKSQKTLEEVVNFCLVNANKGKAVDPASDQMKDIVAYIKSLKKKAPGY